LENDMNITERISRVKEQIGSIAILMTDKETCSLLAKCVKELDEIESNLPEADVVADVMRSLPSDEEIGKIVEQIAYKQLHEEQADDFLEKVWILKNFVKELSLNLPVSGSNDSFKAVKLVPEGWTVLTPMIKTLIGKVDYRHHVQSGLSEDMAKFMAQELNRYLR